VSHANARTTVLGRQLIVDRHQAGWAQAHIAAAMGSPASASHLDHPVRRLRLRCGPEGLAAETGTSARTVSRVLLRAGMPRLSDLDRISGEVIRSSKQTAVRYERDRPGELVHMNVKKLGRIPDGGGWRAHGLAVAETIKRTTPARTGPPPPAAPLETAVTGHRGHPLGVHHSGRHRRLRSELRRAGYWLV